MENIMDFMSTALRGDALSRLSTQMNESPGAMRRGLESAVPASVAALAAYGSGDGKAEELLGTIRGGNYPHVDVDQVERVASDPEATSRIAQSSSGFLSRIFGNRLDGAVDAIAGSSGLGRGSASTLLGLAAPLVMGFVGKEVTSRNLDARGFGGWLADQGRKALGVLPGPLATALGGTAALGGAPAFLGEARAGTGDAARRARAAMDAVHGTGVRGEAIDHRRGANRGIWWVVLGAAALLFLAWQLLRSPRGQDTRTGDDISRAVPVEPAPITPPEQRAAAPTQAPATTAAATGEHMPAHGMPAREQGTAQPAAAEPQPTATGSVAMITSVLESDDPLPATIALEEVEFASSSAVLPDDAMLDDVAGALKQRDTARVQIEGFADTKGTPAFNTKLARARAQAVKDSLVARGVPADHIEAVGRSTQKPVATNDSAEGRAENRRVELTVVAR